MKEDKFPIIFWSAAIPLMILLAAFLIYSGRQESKSNIARAETLLSNTWNQPYEIDKERLNRSKVIFYSDGHRYEISTYDWKIERQ